ncbi:FUN14 family-domain-containing protein [Lactarius akahatsu]|uniref:FUN14 family-domain-containing protein n=1 Tax=Lactarius akahatsu TaxID=416441 RepID=A0AAD4LSS3_9AGAM|nr:FUN14 family-domain-containing protein [Lactarius akahatsu]
MASLHTLAFSRRAVLGRTTFCRDATRAKRTLWKAPISPTLSGTSRPLSDTVAARRMGATVRWTGASLTVGTGLGLLSYANLPRLNCECKSGSSDPVGIPPPPESSVDKYGLTFGTVCGICAGVFVKRGAKLLAFFFGGIFVLLQSLSSASIVKVDWSRAAARFENLMYTTEANGVRRPPSVYSLWRWLVDFLTADFQPRASFIAGFALGVRIG